MTAVRIIAASILAGFGLGIGLASAYGMLCRLAQMTTAAQEDAA